MRVELLYGEGALEIELEGCRILRSREMPALASVEGELERVLRYPISSLSLGDLLKGAAGFC